MLISCLILCSCTSVQTKVEKSVSTFLKEKLKNPKTYVPTNFSKVDSIFQYDTLTQFYSLKSEEYERSKRIASIDSFSLEMYKSDSKKLKESQIEIKRQAEIVDSIGKQLINYKELFSDSAVKKNLVAYKVTHSYKHLGLDNEMVDLNLTFTLDKNFKIIQKALEKGINGQANFEIKIKCKDGGSYYTEYVIDPKFDGQLINSNGITTLTTKAGSHYLTWTAANKNGFNMLMNQETFHEEIKLEDSEFNFTYFVINGKTFIPFSTEIEAINDNYYQKYLK
jgi:hypothetical protein